jgi:hypothetical protein
MIFIQTSNNLHLHQKEFFQVLAISYLGPLNNKYKLSTTLVKKNK